MLVGGGKRMFPDDLREPLKLVDERRFGNGMVFRRTRVLGNPRDCVSETLAPQGQRTLTAGLDARPVEHPMCGRPAARRPTARLVGRAWLWAWWLTSLVEWDSHTRDRHPCTVRSQ